MDPQAVARDLAHFGIPCPSPPGIQALPGDAGARSYLRLTLPGRSLLLMLLGERPDREGGEAEEGGAELPFLNVQRFLSGRGLPVPRIHGYDAAARRLYLEDFGPRHLSASPERYGDAVDLLRLLQARTAEPDPACVAFRRRFGEQAVLAELDEFAAFALPPGTAPPPQLAELAREVAALPPGFSHRDFHGDNLLVRPDGSLGMIDFQDAFLAPRAYDLASLLSDREAPAVLGWDGVDRLRARFDPSAAFEREFWLSVLQRQLKVAGRFVHLARKGKTGYLRYLPHTWGAIRQALRRSGRGELEGFLEALGCFR